MNVSTSRDREEYRHIRAAIKLKQIKNRVAYLKDKGINCERMSILPKGPIGQIVVGDIFEKIRLSEPTGAHHVSMAAILPNNN